MTTEHQEAAKIALEALREINASGNRDPETGHAKADGILVEFIEALGFQEIAEEYEKVEPKWYA